MLEFIGIIAIIYVVVKYFPDFLWFFIKFTLSIVLIIFLFFLLAGMFGPFGIVLV